MNISGNKYNIMGNEVWASFNDYVAVIKPHFCKNGVMMWQLVFSKNSGYPQESNPIYFTTLEDAFNLIENYSEQTTFDNLMNKLFNL